MLGCPSEGSSGGELWPVLPVHRADSEDSALFRLRDSELCVQAAPHVRQKQSHKTALPATLQDISDDEQNGGKYVAPFSKKARQLSWEVTLEVLQSYCNSRQGSCVTPTNSNAATQ